MFSNQTFINYSLHQRRNNHIEIVYLFKAFLLLTFPFFYKLYKHFLHLRSESWYMNKNFFNLQIISNKISILFNIINNILVTSTIIYSYLAASYFFTSTLNSLLLLFTVFSSFNLICCQILSTSMCLWWGQLLLPY